MIRVNTQHDYIGYYCSLNTLKLNEEDAIAPSSKFDAVVCWKPNNIIFLFCEAADTYLARRLGLKHFILK